MLSAPGGWGRGRSDPTAPGGAPVNRRTFEMVVIIVILMQPALGIVRLWAHKAMVANAPGTVMHAVGEDATLTLQR